MKLKVCGLREPQTIGQISRLPIDYIGFHVHKSSPAFIGDRISFDFVRSIPKHIRKTGVFENHDTYSVFSAIARYDLDLVQLQGKESEDICKELKPYVNVMKAFELNEHFNFSILEPFLPYVDYFLFRLPGGNNPDSVYDALQHYPYDIPFFLSGDINQPDLQTIGKLHFPQLFALDLNPGPTASEGLRDFSEVYTIAHQLHQP